MTESRPRGPGLTYAVLSVVIVALLATLALTARQPPPPTIAEFAPQSVENITDAPDDQSSNAGRAGGTGGGGALADGDGTSPSASPIDVPRVRKCVGDPPRQIEDPQSPPCVPYWEGDNGGATYQGVTRDEIRIASPEFSEGLHNVLQNFFNKRFEFYGRRMTLFKVPNEKGDPEEQRADAVYTDEQESAFASTTYN